MGLPLLGHVSQLVGILKSFHEERITSSHKNIEVVLPSKDFKGIISQALQLGKIVEEKEEVVVDALKKGGTTMNFSENNMSWPPKLVQIVEEKDEEVVLYDNNKFYRLAGTHSSMLNAPFLTPPTAKDYPNKILESIKHDIVHKEDFLLNLQTAKNMYVYLMIYIFFIRHYCFI